MGPIFRTPDDKPDAALQRREVQAIATADFVIADPKVAASAVASIKVLRNRCMDASAPAARESAVTALEQACEAA